MRSNEALKEFQKYLAQNGDAVPGTPGAGAQRMCSFYKDVRTDDVDLEGQGDMLLFQWGTYDWGKGKHFQVDITRQLIRGSEDDDEIWQLHLTYYFPPSDALSVLGKGSRWCGAPAELAAFEELIADHPVIQAVGQREDGRVELDYVCAG